MDIFIIPILLFIAVILGLRVLYVSCRIIWFSWQRQQRQRQRRSQNGSDSAAAHNKIHLHIVLGGCGPREEAACRAVLATHTTHSDYRIWILSPARKRVSHYESYGVDLEKLRIINKSVDTVTNFTFHAHEIGAFVLGGGEVVTIHTCPQHVKRAQLIANVVLIPLGVWPRVVPAAVATTATSNAGENSITCSNCLSVTHNGTESTLRTARDVACAVSWSLFRIDWSFLAMWVHEARSSPDRCLLDFDGGSNTKAD